MNNFFQGTPNKNDNQPSGFGINGQLPFQQNTSIVPFQQNNSTSSFGSSGINSPFQQSSSVSPFTSINNNNFGSNQPSLSTFGSANTFTPNPSFVSSSTSPFGNSMNNNTLNSNPLSSNPLNSNPLNTNPLSNNPLNQSNTPIFGNSSMYNPSSFNTNTSAPLSQSNTFTSNRAWSSAPVTPWGAKDKGSKATPYSSTRIMDDNNVFVELTHISGMKEYSNKSVDEIRKEDYEMSLTPPKQGNTFGSSSFSQQSGIGYPFSSSNTSGFTKPFSSFSSNPVPFNNPISSSATNSFGTNLTNTSSTPFSTGISNTSSTPFSTGISNTSSTPFSTGISNTSSTPFSTGISNTSSSPFSAGISNTSSSPFGNTSALSNQFAGNPLNNTNPVSLGNTNFNAPSNNSQVTNPSLSSNPLFGNTSLFGNNNNSSQPLGSTLFNTQPSNPINPSVSTPSLFSNFNSGSSNNLNSSTLGNNNQFTSNPNNSTSQNPFSNNNSGVLNLSNPINNNPFSNNSTLMGTNTLLGTSGLPNQFNNNNMFSNNNQSNSTQMINNNDPYLLKDIKFDKFEQQKPNIRIPLPSPIFKTKKETPVIDLHIRPPRPISKNSFFTIPDLKELDNLQSISNLVIGFEGKGRIEFLEPVTLTSPEDIDKRISFKNETVEISDSIGTGLNKRARVFIEKLYPICRTTNEVIKGKAESFPQKGIQERFIYQLKNDTTKKFIDYNPDTGIYVYEVNHF